MAGITSDVRRRLPVVGAQCRIGAGRQERLERAGIVVLGRGVERCPAVALARVGLRTSRQEQLDDLGMGARRRRVERENPEVVLRSSAHVGPGLQQRSRGVDRARATEERRVVESREPVRTARHRQSGVDAEKLANAACPAKRGGVEDVELRRRGGQSLGDGAAAAVQSVEDRADAVVVAVRRELRLTGEKDVELGPVVPIDRIEELGGRCHLAPTVEVLEP